MQMLSQIGLVLLMFQIGLEFDFAHLTERNNRRAVTYVASASMVAPFALGFGFGWFSAPLLSPGVDPLASALFIATAFSITALPILGRIMMEFQDHPPADRRHRHQCRRHQRRHRLAAARAHHRARLAEFSAAAFALRWRWSACFSSPGGSSCGR